MWNGLFIARVTISKNISKEALVGICFYIMKL